MMHMLTNRPLQVFAAFAACSIVAACGGGGSDGSSSAICTGNIVAPVDASIADLAPAFGGKVLIGRICRPTCESGGGLTIYADASGGSISGSGGFTFGVTSVCRNTNVPDTFYASGKWSDGTKFQNAQFLPLVVKVRTLTMPANGGYFTMP